jgi:hypothetical protein
MALHEHLVIFINSTNHLIDGDRDDFEKKLFEFLFNLKLYSHQ